MRYVHFSKTERLEFSILLKKGYSLRDIGRALKRNPSSVSRELKRNSVRGQYDPHKAQHKAYVARKYSKYQGMKIIEEPRLHQYVRDKLQAEWTPEEIAGRLSLENGNRTVISFKSIYKYLRTPYGYWWCRYLPSRRDYVKKRREKKQERVLIPNRILIEERPILINKRLRIGDFEGDTLGVPKGTRVTIAGVVDRSSRYFLAKKIASLKEAMTGFKVLLNSAFPVWSFTLDNGVENVKYETLGIPTYFCHPYSSWEKGSIENAFQRLRRWIPKKQPLTVFTEEEITAIVERMNNTPRKCLGWRTPKEVFEEQEEQRAIPLLISNLQCCTSG